MAEQLVPSPVPQNDQPPADMPQQQRTPAEKKIRMGRSMVFIRLGAKGRTISIAPPRFWSEQQQTWLDGALFPDDLPALIFALQKVLDYCYSTPVPSQDNDPPPPAPF